MAECIFCKIIRKEIKAKIEFEDEDVLIFQDIDPQAPVHVLAIPKRHIEKISDVEKSDELVLGRLILRVKQLADNRRWADYRLIFNNGAVAGQTVFHIHLHLLSGRRMTWPPG